MQNPHFGSKIKIQRNMSKSFLQMISSCSVQKTAPKHTKYSRNDSAVARVIYVGGGGGALDRQRREPLGGVGVCCPRKFWNLQAWKCYFQCSPGAICHLRISQIIYFVHCLRKSMHIESLTLEIGK